ncbi:hypothetical protein AE51_01967 [Escherichia coli BIDMC 76]|nr:hypothetical protein AE51_01967 [Escherichia coli BIDMC 76]
MLFGSFTCFAAASVVRVVFLSPSAFFFIFLVTGFLPYLSLGWWFLVRWANSCSFLSLSRRRWSGSFFPGWRLVSVLCVFVLCCFCVRCGAEVFALQPSALILPVLFMFIVVFFSLGPSVYPALSGVPLSPTGFNALSSAALCAVSSCWFSFFACWGA